MNELPTRIQLRRTKGWRLPEGSVRVARPSKEEILLVSLSMVVSRPYRCFQRIWISSWRRVPLI